jgi:methylphosphotriester-DNA--protein-cysteine methyltransferase
VILWCRLAIVGHMLERTGSTVESIGLALGFPSHTALRNQVKRYTGRTATAIRQEGGLAAVLAAWRRKLASRGVRLPIP